MGLILLDPRADDQPVDRSADGPRRVPLWALLAGILLLGAALRLVGVNWDAGQHLHPDERFLTMVENALQLPSTPWGYFDTDKSPLNPYNRGYNSFVYGTVPLFLVRVVAEIASWNNYGDITLLGRAMSALFDVGTILLLFLIGRRLFNWRIALLAAFLVAVTPLHIQQSHFFTMDSFLVFFLMVAFYYAVRVVQEGGSANYALMGLFYGVATASKINAITFGIVVLAACAVRAWLWWLAYQRGGTRRADPAVPHSLEEPIAGFLVALAVAFIAFRIGQPYAFNGPGLLDVGLNPKYLADMDSWRKIGAGEVDYPPGVQWANRTAYLYPLQQLVLWGMGVPLGLASWAGVALALWVLGRYLYRRGRVSAAERAGAAWRMVRDPALLALPLVWIGFNWLYWGGAFLKPMRYFLVIYPLLILLGAWTLLVLWAWARDYAARHAVPLPASPTRGEEERPGVATPRPPPLPAGEGGRGVRSLAPYLPRAALAVMLAVVGWTTLYAFAYATIYMRTTTRVAASEWIYRNIPPGNLVGNEHWDDPIPLNLPQGNVTPYAGPQLELYAEEELSKRDRLIQALNQASIIAITSNRLYDSIPRIPERYPMAIEYYKALFSGELGFEKIATIASYPSLGPLELRDDNAEELWTVYDHPKVMIFRKTPAYSAENARAILDRAPLDRVIKGLRPIQAQTHGLVMQPELRAAQEAGGTWSDIVDRDSLLNRYPALSWWLMAVLLGLVAYPLAWAVFGRLADRGYGIAKVLAIALLAWGAWLLASLRWLPYTRETLLLVLGLMLLASAIVVWRRRAAFVADLRLRWEQLLFAEAVFAAAYVFFHGVRMANPDLWHSNFGGEKPMDFAYLNAVLKSTYFPPYDPWYAGGFINYYYFGQVLVATLIKLTGVVPSVAYNLAVALFFALLVSGCYSFAFNWLLPVVSRRRAQASDQPSAVSRQPSAVSYQPSGVGDPRLAAVGGGFPAEGEVLVVAPRPLVSGEGDEGAAGEPAEAPGARPADELPSPRRVGWATAGGLLAAVFVCLMGNLDGLVQVFENLGKVSNMTLTSTIPGVTGLVRGAAGLAAVLGGSAQMAPFDFWRSTRVIGPEDPGPITEFPYFTFLYGDLHAHMLALPLTLLALHVALALARSGGLLAVWEALRSRPTPPDPPSLKGRGEVSERVAAFGPGLPAGAEYGATVSPRPPLPSGARGAGAAVSPRSPLPFREGGLGGVGLLLTRLLGQEVLWLIALGGLVVGLLRATNTWDFPTYLLLLVGAGAIAEYRAARAITLEAATRAVLIAAGIYVAATLAVMPYTANFALFYTGIEPIRWRTSLVHYVTVLGFFLFAVGSLLVYEVWLLRRKVLPLLATTPLLQQAGPVQGFWSPPRAAGTPAFSLPSLSWGLVAGYALVGWLLLVALLLLVGQVVPAVVVLLLGLVLALVPWHRQRADRLLLLGMIALALALTAAVEFVALKGDIGRMNTVFKFYLQVWTLLGLAAAIGLVLLLRRWRWRVPAWRWWSAAVVLLVVGCLLYPLLATPVKLGYRFNPLPPTDDGMAYMQAAVYADRGNIPLASDYEAIKWMQDNIPGSPVVLEANTGLYKWGSRVSVYTGLPSVVGWDWHQRQQRGDFAPYVQERVADVERMYATTQFDELQRLIRKYGVEYIYVGPLERAYYPEPGLQKFRDLVGTMLDLVYDRGGVQIYRVK